MTSTGLLDEVYEQLHCMGPEFRGWLSNHAPMAADALVRLGHDEAVHPWLCGYVDRLEPAPRPRWEITEQDWREPLGDASRLGDWCELLTKQVHTEPWETVLARWWPRLLPGAIASAAHGLIRTGHAVRAVAEQVSTARLDELGQVWATGPRGGSRYLKPDRPEGRDRPGHSVTPPPRWRTCPRSTAREVSVVVSEPGLPVSISIRPGSGPSRPGRGCCCRRRSRPRSNR